jgi:hypothetical protein
MLRKYFCSPVDLIGDRVAAVSPLGGGGGSMDLTVKVEEDEEDDDATVGGRTAPNWLQELNGANNSVNSSWDSGVVLDTNTVVQMAEFQEIIDSLQKCGAGEGMALPPPPYNSSSISNSNHQQNNNTNSFHVTQQQQQAISSAPPPTVVLSPSSSPPPVVATANQHQFLYPDLELEQMLLLPPQRLGAASYHAGDSSALLTAAEKLGRGGVVTCQSLPLLTDQQATLAGGNSNNMAVSSAAGGEPYALQLRCTAFVECLHWGCGSGSKKFRNLESICMWIFLVIPSTPPPPFNQN